MKFLGLGYDGTDNECTQYHAVFEFHDQKAKSEAKPQYRDQHHFIATESGDVSKKSGDQKDTDQQGDNHEKRQFGNREENVASADAAGDGYAGEQGDQANAQNVLDDQDTEYQLGKALMFHFQVIQGLDDNGCRRDGENGSEKEGVKVIVPAKPEADLVAEPDHDDDFKYCCDQGGCANL